MLFGDDAEADAFIYSLYADLVAGRVDEPVLAQVLEAARGLPRRRAERIVAAWETIPRADPVRRIFIHLDRLTPPAHFARYGPRVVPIFNYFQAALVLLADGHLTAPQVVKVAVEMVQTAGYNLLTLSQLVPGPAAARAAHRRRSRRRCSRRWRALQGPDAVLQALRPVPDIIAAFTSGWRRSGHRLRLRKRGRSTT